MEKTSVAIRQWISNMAENSKQFSSRTLSSKWAHEVTTIVGNHRLKNKVTKLTFYVRQLAIGQHQQVHAENHRGCVIYNFVEHPTDACPTLQEIDLIANVAGILIG